MPILTFQSTSAISPPWTNLPSLALGAGEVRDYLLITEDGSSSRVLRLCRDGAETWFKVEAIAWEDQIVVGFGARVYFVGRDAKARCIRLSDYFCGFHGGDGFLLIASGTTITSIDRAGEVNWKSAPLGIDGVIIERVT